jgi:hypothetical protein
MKTILLKYFNADVLIQRKLCRMTILQGTFENISIRITTHTHTNLQHVQAMHKPIFGLAGKCADRVKH